MLKIAGFGAVAWLLTVSTAAADVRLTLQGGRVSIIARDATVRQILTEWARIGQTRIVNLDRIPGGPISLEFTNVHEQQVLEVLLRSVSGYLLAPREVPAENLSRFDRIIVMPTSVAPRVGVASPPPVFQPPPRLDSGDDNEPTQGGPRLGPPRGPVFTTFPQPQIVDPSQDAPEVPVALPQQPFTTPGVIPGLSSSPGGAPVAGSARPGEIIQPPPQQPRQEPGAQPNRPPNPPGN